LPASGKQTGIAGFLILPVHPPRGCAARLPASGKQSGIASFFFAAGVRLAAFFLPHLLSFANFITIRC
jgi:hypothetical protein